MMLNVPRKSPAMYSRVVWFGGSNGFGPCGFASGVVPLPLAMYSFLSAALYRTEVGYQPEGMRPRGCDLPGSAVLKTAMLLASAFATKSICPSGVRLKL